MLIRPQKKPVSLQWNLSPNNWKAKIIDPCERSVFQLLEQYVEGSNNNPLAYYATAKAHATMLQKRFLPMYLEHLAFVIKRAGWKVTKIHAHLTFE